MEFLGGKMKNNLNVFIVFLLLINLSACIGQQVDTDFKNIDNLSGVVKNDSETCMSPLFDDAIPMGEESFVIADAIQDDIILIPPNTWNKKAVLPLHDLSFQAIHFTGAEESEELWFRNFKDSGISYWTFSPIKKEWEEKVSYSSEHEYFFDTQNQLWLFTSENSTLEFLMFDKKLNTLVSMFEIPHQEYFSWYLRYSYSPTHNLWLLTHNHETNSSGLFLVDLESGELTNPRRPEEGSLDISNNWITLKTDQKGRLFTLNIDGIVERFNVSTGEIARRGIPTAMDILDLSSRDFFFTQDDRVLLDDRAIFDNGEYLSNLHVIFRSPVFITKIFNGVQPFVWESPEPQAETEDGRIWYKSNRGLAWHQPETGEWCMFTSAKSNIVKDSQGNLWIVYDNALYMLPASETNKQE